MDTLRAGGQAEGGSFCIVKQSRTRLYYLGRVSKVSHCHISELTLELRSFGDGIVIAWINPRSGRARDEFVHVFNLPSSCNLVSSEAGMHA